MAILLLINEQEIKDITSLTDNVDSTKFAMWIQVCQDKYIKPAIGETCYDALLDSVENDDPTALETILLDGDARSFGGIKPALAWWVNWMALVDLWLNIGNATVQKRKGENFDAVSIEEFNIKRKEAEDTATYYTNYLIDYIKCNVADYPCYDCEGLTPLIDETNSTGIALDNDEF
jgi:hypothetical protein